MSDDERMKKGADVLGKLLGDGPGGGVTLPDDFRRKTVGYLFGEVWTDDTLALEERSLITCVTLVALGRENEQRIHFAGAKNLGIPRKRLEAAITHVAHYAGWPVSVSAFKVLNEVWPEE